MNRLACAAALVVCGFEGLALAQGSATAAEVMVRPTWVRTVDVSNTAVGLAPATDGGFYS